MKRKVRLVLEGFLAQGHEGSSVILDGLFCLQTQLKQPEQSLPDVYCMFSYHCAARHQLHETFVKFTGNESEWVI